MTAALLIYIAVSLLIGGIAATIEIWFKPIESQRADFLGAISVGVFVAICWPFLLIGVLL